MTQPVIVSATRTAIGRFMGGLSPFRASELGAFAIREAIARAGLEPEDIDEVIMGHVVQGGCGQNPARQAALGAGLPDTINAYTVNKVCASGMKSAALAAQSVASGEADFIVAGGQESMSQGPRILRDTRSGTKLGDMTLTDGMVFDGLWDIHNDFHMGITAELISERLNVTREEMDSLAYNSHARAVKAIREGYFADEIVPVSVPQRKKDPITFDTDEGPREDTSLESLAKLRPVFKKDGVVTAGNASSINDGASALVISTAEKCAEKGITPMAKIVAWTSAHLAPDRVMEAPIPAFRALSEKTGIAFGDVELFEINEPFAAASFAVNRELGLDPELVNVSGGGVSLGHPIGATGARIITTLLYGMKRLDRKIGMAGLCLGGGGAMAMSIEMM